MSSTESSQSVAERTSPILVAGHQPHYLPWIGYSWRMTEIQAVIGATQVRRLDEIVARRMAIAATYDAAFRALPRVQPLHTPAGDCNAYYKYPLKLAPSLDRRAVQQRLDAEFGVRSGTSYYPPCHLQPAYREAFGYREGDYPVAEAVLAQVGGG